MRGIKDEGIFSCGKAQNKNLSLGDLNIMGERLNLHLYSLVFELGSLELHFQSFEKYDKKIVLNTDLVPLKVEH